MFSFNLKKKLINIINIRQIHNLQKYIFVCDNSYNLIEKVKQKQMSSLQIDFYETFPNSYGRQLLHPTSSHIASDYACKYYSNSKPYQLGDYPIQFFASEYFSLKEQIVDTSINKNNHSIIIYPDNLKIKNIKKENIDHMIKLCSSDDYNTKDKRIEKLKGISIYFFSDVVNINRIQTLYQLFDYCFQQYNYKEVNYIFSTGNLKDSQQSSIIITNGKYNRILPTHITVREIFYFVSHLLSFKQSNI
jgi:hypothetical protein